MQVIESVASMRAACRAVRSRPDTTLGLVPTMGALHAGHVALVQAARASCDRVAVSLFVNPLQFAPGEDLARYPRTWDRDRALLEAEGVDLLFAPSAAEMAPGPTEAWVDVPEIGARLDGRSRPGHFRGVSTVVAKLFHIVTPDRAFFGQKDAAQVAVLRAMVRGLHFGVELCVCPTVRGPDGLALSSRNVYLGAEERVRALGLRRALRAAERAAAGGERDAARLQGLLRAELEAPEGSAVPLRVDYAELVDPDTLEPVADLQHGALAAVAAWVGGTEGSGGTRLIDNVLLPGVSQ